MGKNKLIIQEEVSKADEKNKESVNGENQEEKKTNKFFQIIQGIAGGDKLEYILRGENLVFVLYIGLLGILYISNSYYAQNTLRKIEKIKVQIKELRFDYVTTKKSLIESSRRNRVIENLAEYNINIKESKVPPYKLEIIQK